MCVATGATTRLPSPTHPPTTNQHATATGSIIDGLNALTHDQWTIISISASKCYTRSLRIRSHCSPLLPQTDPTPFAHTCEGIAPRLTPPRLSKHCPQPWTLVPTPRDTNKTHLFPPRLAFTHSYTLLTPPLPVPLSRSRSRSRSRHAHAHPPHVVKTHARYSSRPRRPAPVLWVSLVQGHALPHRRGRLWHRWVSCLAANGAEHTRREGEGYTGRERSIQGGRRSEEEAG